MKFTHYIEQTVELPDPKDPNGIASFSTDLQKNSVLCLQTPKPLRRVLIQTI